MHTEAEEEIAIRAHPQAYMEEEVRVAIVGAADFLGVAIAVEVDQETHTRRLAPEGEAVEVL